MRACRAKTVLVMLPALLLMATTPAKSARDTLSIVGSSTVYPFTMAVAEQFGRSGRFKTPKVASTGTGGGFELFCGGVGEQHADIANASRRIKPAERDICAKNGVGDIVEIKIGYDGIVIGRGRKASPLKLTRHDVYRALAKQIPDPLSPQKLIANPNKTWKQVNPALPNQKIEVFGPPPSSGTRDAFSELVLEAGCSTYPWIKVLKDLDANRYERICDTLREDEAYTEAGENDDLIVKRIVANPNAVGIFGYSFLNEHKDKIVGGMLEGFGPTFETISAGRYVASRPLYLYVKKAHVGIIPGLQEFIAEYLSDKAMEPQGYLAGKGLVPLRDAERSRIRADALALKTL